jgi:CRISPR-associated protein Cmr6
MNTRRDVLKSLKVANVPSTNAGLWLDKYFDNQNSDDAKRRADLVKEVSQIAIPESYSAFYNHWKDMLKAYEAEIRTAKAKGRMIIGLGNESILETSVTLHRTYGVPYIPGSALKGLAASYARQRLDESWQIDSEAYKIVFGDTDNAGYITFFDALYVPGSGYALYPDVITVHHKNYYKDASNPPADWDSPTPVPFLSATGSYLVALAASELKIEAREIWLNAIFDILKHALLDLGIGAKTSSGYGRMELEVPPPPPKDPDLQKAENYRKSLEVMPTKDVASQINGYYQQWQKLTSVEGKKIVAEAIIKKVHDAQRQKQSQEKRWYQELLEFLQNIGD